MHPYEPIVHYDQPLLALIFTPFSSALCFAMDWAALAAAPPPLVAPLVTPTLWAHEPVPLPHTTCGGTNHICRDKIGIYRDFMGFNGIRLGFIRIYRDFSAGKCWGDVTSWGKWLGLNILNRLSYQWEQEKHGDSNHNWILVLAGQVGFQSGLCGYYKLYMGAEKKAAKAETRW